MNGQECRQDVGYVKYPVMIELRIFFSRNLTYCDIINVIVACE